MDFLAGLLEPFHWQFMRNALLAVLVISPLFGLLSTIVDKGEFQCSFVLNPTRVTEIRDVAAAGEKSY